MSRLKSLLLFSGAILFGCESNTNNASITDISKEPRVVNAQTINSDSVIFQHRFKIVERGSTVEYAYILINGMRCIRVDGYYKYALDCDWSTFDSKRVNQ